MPNRSIVLCLIILTMNGCQSTPESAEVQNKVPRDRGDVSSTSKNTEKYSASQYRSVSKILNKALGRINARQSLDALDILKDLVTENLPGPLNDQYQRLSAMAYSQLDNKDQALLLMNLVSAPSRQDLELLVQLCSGLQNYACSARNLIRLHQEHGALTSSTFNQQKSQDAIWAALMLADAPELPFSSPLEPGWWSLRDSIVNSGSVERARLALAQWTRRNPNHTAAHQLPSMLDKLQSYKPPKTALILPLTGRLSNVGDAVRDGFLGGYFADSSSHSQRDTQTESLEIKPISTQNIDLLQAASGRIDQSRISRRSFTLYDSASAPLSDLVALAKADGADLIIGPLRKDKARRMSELAAQANIPTLLLNYIEANTGTSSLASEKAEIYQLGTAIENEAATLVASLLGSDHQRILVVHSGQSWSQRALAEFQNLWPFPITIARFDEIKQVTSAVGGSMGVADSVARKTELTQLFDQEMQFLPRARQDLDAVVALTSNVESRALVPALRFHFANNLPVYATSQSIRGGSNIRELAGFTVTELPILANPSLNMRNLVSTYALTSSPLVELYALGYDAYQLATWIHLLNQSEKTSTQRTLRLSMATGIIQLSPNGRFQRTLDLVNIDRRGRLQEIKKSL